MKESDLKIIVKKDSISFEGEATLEYLFDMYRTACGEQAFETPVLESAFYGKNRVANKEKTT